MIHDHYAPVFQSTLQSEAFADLPDDACRLFYVMLCVHCDSHGRSQAKARLLRSPVWGLLERSTEETARVLRELEKVDLIRLYQAGGEELLFVPGWETKQGTVGRKDRKPEPLYPTPSGDCEKPAQHVTGSAQSGDSPSPNGGCLPPLQEALGPPIRSDPSPSDPIRPQEERKKDAHAREASPGESEPDRLKLVTKRQKAAEAAAEKKLEKETFDRWQRYEFKRDDVERRAGNRSGVRDWPGVTKALEIMARETAPSAEPERRPA